MKKRLVLLGVALAILGCSGNQNVKVEDSKEQPEKQVYAETTIDSLLLNSKHFEDKPVRIAGIVDHVCIHSSKKLTLLGKSTGATLKVTASDSVPQFDMTLKGTRVEVTGILKRVVGPNETCENETKTETETEIETANNPADQYYVECHSIKVY